MKKQLLFQSFQGSPTDKILDQNPGTCLGNKILNEKFLMHLLD